MSWVSIVFLCLLLTLLPQLSIAQTVVNPPIKPAISESIAKLNLSSYWPDVVGFNDTTMWVFSKTRSVNVPVARGTLKHLVLRFAPDTAGYVALWLTTTVNDTAKDTLIYRYKNGIVNQASRHSSYRTGDTSNLYFSVRKIGLNDSVTAAFFRLPFNLFTFDSATAFIAGSQTTDILPWLRDSVSQVLALLRWGIEAISYTDSTFYTFHEQELGRYAVRYFANSFTDAQVDSIQRSGAKIFYQGTKATNGRTPLRGYGR